MTSNCELGCTKLGSSIVSVSCASAKRSNCHVQKFPLAGYELTNLLKLVVGETPAKILAVGAVQGYCEWHCVGSDASPLWSAVLGRNT